eukprot:m.120261 g.120261  ORF g.120261 m.120261 type:complete len:197 (-) comp15608_c0_seq7:54-644(-)
MDRASDTVVKERQTSEALTQGLMGLLTPLLQKVDGHVAQTQATQTELATQLDRLEEELAKFSSLQDDIPDVSASTKRLAETKATLVKTIALITSIENRVAKMNKTAAKAADQLEKKRQAATAQTEGVAASLHPEVRSPPEPQQEVAAASTAEQVPASASPPVKAADSGAADAEPAADNSVEEEVADSNDATTPSES